MIEKATVEEILTEILEGKDIFIVDVKVDSSRKIRVHIDRMEGISIDDCVSVSRELENRLDRDREDFALEVSSPGLDSPFRVKQQYEKNMGKTVTVQCRDGRKLQGVLLEADDEGIRLELDPVRKNIKPERLDLEMEEIVSTRLYVQF
jgi:ribosome maturation factor RimP